MKDGRKKNIFTPAETVTKVIFATHMNLYVGWNPGESNIVVSIKINVANVVALSCFCSLLLILNITLVPY